jgi:hypothetical protein
VRRGFLSIEKARDSYGVVIDVDGVNVDRSATEELRGGLRRDRPSPLPVFDFGPNAPESQEAINEIRTAGGVDR